MTAKIFSKGMAAAKCAGRGHPPKKIERNNEAWKKT
jgi:hypothetical protein